MNTPSGPHIFEDDLPEHANIDDLTAAMATILVGEVEAYLAKVADFVALYPETAVEPAA